MGVAAFDDRIELAAEVRGACVLLIDGLGAELLDAHADDAPVMAELRGRTLQAGFPSTTVAGLAAVGTGCRSGQHGMVGLSFRLPGVGVVNTLRWRRHPWGDDLRDAAPPEQVQPLATTFEQAASAGVAVSVVSGAEFTGSGLTRAVLRGGRYVGVQALGDLAAGVRTAVADGGFCYGYHGEVDLLGHIYGPGSPAWRMQLREVDRLVESLVEGLPPGGLLAIVADHGMVVAEPDRHADAEHGAGSGGSGIGRSLERREHEHRGLETFAEDREERHHHERGDRAGHQRVRSLALQGALEIPRMAVHPHDHVGDAGNGDQREHAFHRLARSKRQRLAEQVQRDRDARAEQDGGEDAEPHRP